MEDGRVGSSVHTVISMQSFSLQARRVGMEDSLRQRSSPPRLFHGACLGGFLPDVSGRLYSKPGRVHDHAHRVLRPGRHQRSVGESERVVGFHLSRGPRERASDNSTVKQQAKALFNLKENYRSLLLPGESL